MSEMKLGNYFWKCKMNYKGKIILWVLHVENISIYKHFKFLNNDLVRFKVMN